MSNEWRRRLAIAVCVGVGGLCFVMGMRAFGVGAGVRAGLLLGVSGFLLLSAVGLARPYLARGGVGRGVGRGGGR